MAAFYSFRERREAIDEKRKDGVFCKRRPSIQSIFLEEEF
jgi:hypothetical protein